MGTPYRLGSSSNTTATFDCSSFVQRVFKENGISLPRSAIQQYNASNTRPIAKSQLKPGDLIFTGDSRSPNTIRHVGIYYGDNKIIHTYGPGGVRIDPMRNWLDLNRGWVVAVARVNGVN
ncbi:C40 family peptidase [Desmospora profundinema]|uniref:Cell wall-associated NlpC family hydrolase n=1 Tax=Desmospora profundinema TaxID=1571184 RepID=A0ABU1INI3_9BACL|nr:C40 family peptidase [Desmospora profundinema]MDR6226333.1 cell wall-associated NlpC family hydrolase [Desmospora profundinema]